MAEKRTRTQTGPVYAPDCRALMAANLREKLALPEKLGRRAHEGYAQYLTRRLAQVESGSPLARRRQELPKAVREQMPPGDPDAWWRLDGDTLTPTESPVVRDTTEDESR